MPSSGSGQQLNQPQQYTKFQPQQQQPSSIFDHPYYPDEQLEKSIELSGGGGGVHQSRMPHEPEVETPQRLNKIPTTSYSGQTEWQKQQPELLEQLEQQPWQQRQEQSLQQPERDFLNDQQEEDEQWQFQTQISTSSPYSPTPQSIGGGRRFEKEMPEEEDYTNAEELSAWKEIYPSSRGSGSGKKGQRIQKQQQRPQEKTLFKNIE